MNFQREEFSATLSPDGQSVYVFGGHGKNGVLDSIEKYTFGEQNWVSVGKMSAPRRSF